MAKNPGTLACGNRNRSRSARNRCAAHAGEPARTGLAVVDPVVARGVRAVAVEEVEDELAAGAAALELLVVLVPFRGVVAGDREVGEGAARPAADGEERRGHHRIARGVRRVLLIPDDILAIDGDCARRRDRGRY